MGFPVYDFRTDIRNILVTPEIRSRFLKIEPGMPASFHSHDLGQEIFLILAGRCEFTIDGETEILEPGQLCIALVDQLHSVRALDNQPVIMYLSVTPHILPTHTFWNEDGSKKPPVFAPHNAYDVEIDTSVTVEDLLAQQVDAMQTVAAAAEKAAQLQAKQAAAYRQAIAQDDLAAATVARNAMWDALSEVHASLFAMDSIWNELAPRMIEERDAG